MKHLGDITKINGAEITPVDCIIGGSPCQDLSVAGKRTGLDGERSGLFMEQIRIVKEMRENDRRKGRTNCNIRPKWLVWENVPGAFSSGKPKGSDFQTVLTEIVRIVKPDAPDVPLPTRGGWRKAGCIMGYGDDGCPFSIAWRVHDAQFWGVPQRRKRIAVVADFGGISAPEICFERRGLRWNPSESGEAREETPGDSGEGTEGAIGFNRERSGAVTAENIMLTLQAAAGESGNNKPMVLVYNGENITSPTNHTNPKPGDPSHTIGTDPRNYVVCLQGNGIDRADTAGCNGKGWNDDGVCYTLNTVDRPAVFAAGFDHNAGAKSGSVGYQNEVAPTLEASKAKSVLVLNDQGGSVMDVSDDKTGMLRAQTHGHEPIMIEMTSTKNTIVQDGTCPTLTARMGTGGNQVNAVCMDVGLFTTEEEKSGTFLARQYKDPPITYQECTGPLMASGYQKNGSQEAANDMYIVSSKVRRLTPLECERLMGFPDNWTNIGEWIDSKGKKHKESDSPRYKALGNSIAIPFFFHLLRRISAQYERPATMGSLFDGIGGFPLCWERCNGKGTAIWASEIEEFPIAVTKFHFPEEEE